MSGIDKINGISSNESSKAHSSGQKIAPVPAISVEDQKLIAGKATDVSSSDQISQLKDLIASGKLSKDDLKAAQFQLQKLESQKDTSVFDMAKQGDDKKQ